MSGAPRTKTAPFLARLAGQRGFSAMGGCNKLKPAARVSGQKKDVW